MLNQVYDNKLNQEYLPIIANAMVSGYFVLDRDGQLSQSYGLTDRNIYDSGRLIEDFPMLQRHINNPDIPGVFYKVSDQSHFPENGSKGLKAVYIGSLADEEKVLGILYDKIVPDFAFETIRSEIFILSLITQAVRAFSRADNLQEILNIALIGVTAGSGLGFNRAFILLTCDEETYLEGAFANGPSSPEEAGFIWHKLSSGELTLEKMFEEALNKNHTDSPLLNGLVQSLRMPLNNKDNIFTKAALENKSMIIGEEVLTDSEYTELCSKIGSGPLAVVPMVSSEHLQGIIIADNFITRKVITDNDLQLLEIFARYASDSIEMFRLNERLEKKVTALKEANEIILRNRENIIKAEKLTVLADMAGQVAHEIRNPLTIIGGYAKLMLKKISSDNEDFENLELITNQVSRVEQALDKFTSLMNYQQKNDQLCDIGELIKSTLAIKPPGMSFSKFKLQYDKPVKIMVDPDMFRQALLIVLKRISLNQKCKTDIILAVERINDKALIYIKPGSDDDSLAGDLYKSINSAGNHKKFRELSTSWEILKYYGGNIGLETSPDKGQNFYLEFPIYKEDK